MSAAASAADVCLAALECCSEANAAHASRDFYGAIRALGEIRKVHIPAVGVASAELAGYLERCAPRCEAQIVRQVTQELNAWLTEARSLARAAGMAGIRAATARRRRLAELAKQQDRALASMHRTDGDGGGVLEFPLGDERDEDEGQANGAGLQEDDGAEAIDLTPLHRCAHVQSMLGRSDDFAAYYVENRAAQLRSDLSKVVAGLGDGGGGNGSAGGGASDPGVAFLQSYQSSVAQVVGFFLVEARVLRSGVNGLSAAATRALWGEAAFTLASALRTSAGVMRDPGQVLVVRDFVALAADAVRAVGFDARSLDAALNGTREMYMSLLANDAAEQIRSVLSTGSLEPFEVSTEGEMERQVVAYGLHELAVGQASEAGRGQSPIGVASSAGDGNAPPASPAASSSPRLPWRAPFSASVPRVCQLTSRFLGDMAQFLGTVSMPAAEARAALASGVSTLLAEAAPGAVDGALSAESLPVAKAVRLSLDAAALKTSCAALERRAKHVCWQEMRVEVSPKELFAQATLALEAASKRATDCAANTMLVFVERYRMANAGRSWAPDAPPAVSQGLTVPSAEMEDLAEQLAMSFASVRAFLSREEYARLCAQPLGQAGAWLAGALASEASRHWNPWGLATLDAELRRLETAVRSAELPDTQLAEARQLVSLLQSQSLERLDEAGYLQRQYPRLSAAKVLIVLEKYREPPSDRSSFMRRKAVDAALKKLRRH